VGLIVSLGHLPSHIGIARRACDDVNNRHSSEVVSCEELHTLNFKPLAVAAVITAGTIVMTAECQMFAGWSYSGLCSWLGADQ